MRIPKDDDAPLGVMEDCADVAGMSALPEGMICGGDASLRMPVTRGHVGTSARQEAHHDRRITIRSCPGCEGRMTYVGGSVTPAGMGARTHTYGWHMPGFGGQQSCVGSRTL